jgi:riboflavin synthase
MFTGIIEHIGTIDSLAVHREGGRVTVHAPTLAGSLAVSNSIAVNGCCLTIVSTEKDKFSADLSGETLRKTSFGAESGALITGSRVNLEPPLNAGKELGGHFVLGHVDGIGRVTHLQPEGENWWLGVQVPEDFARYIVPQGSATIDGISLTVARWHNFVAPAKQSLTVEVAVIPYTYEHTTLRDRKPGDAVNLEADILGKYVERYLEARHAAREQTTLTIEALVREGF